MHTVNDACRHVPEAAIPVDLPIEVRIHSLASEVCDAREETIRVQLELNLQITKLRLKAQPSTPPEIKEQHTSAIAARLEDMRGAVCECTNMLEQELEVLTTL